jgi:hypothetical protein
MAVGRVNRLVVELRGDGWEIRVDVLAGRG